MNARKPAANSVRSVCFLAFAAAAFGLLVLMIPGLQGFYIQNLLHISGPIAILILAPILARWLVRSQVELDDDNGGSFFVLSFLLPVLHIILQFFEVSSVMGLLALGFATIAWKYRDLTLLIGSLVIFAGSLVGDYGKSPLVLGAMIVLLLALTLINVQQATKQV